MILEKQNILFFTRTMELGGTENVILQLCELFLPYVNKIIVCSSGGIHEKDLSTLGIKHIKIPDIDNKNVFTFFKVYSALKKIIIEENISVIHTHHRMAAFYCQFLFSNKKIKFINTSHTVFFNKRLLTIFAFRNFSLISCGENVKESLVNYFGFKNNQITVIRNAVRIENVDCINSLSQIEFARTNNFQVIASVGRLSKEKGVEFLIKSIALLKNKKLICLIVGAGPEDLYLKSLVKSLQIEDRVFFLGFRKDVLNILKQIDFVVLPSLQEGLPLTPIEAFSCGKTVIGTNIGGTSEIIEDGINGYLVPPADEYLLAKSIDHMSIVDRKKLEENAKNTYINNYSYDLFCKRYLDFYRHLE